MRLPSALCKRNRICTQLSCPAAELRCRAGERPKKGACYIDNIELLQGNGLLVAFYPCLRTRPDKAFSWYQSYTRERGRGGEGGGGGPTISKGRGCLSVNLN